MLKTGQISSLFGVQVWPDKSLYWWIPVVCLIALMCFVLKKYYYKRMI